MGATQGSEGSFAVDSPGGSIEEGRNEKAFAIAPKSKCGRVLSQLCLLDELENPQRYSQAAKWVITSVVAVAGVAGPMGSAIFFPALSQVSDALDTSITTVNLCISVYMLSMAFCPLWWSAFSERFGRRKIYLLSFLLFILSNVLGAHAKSIGVLIGMRLLSGAASSSGQTIGAGVIADVWEPKERGKAMGVFWLGPLCGPLISPIIGGALSQEWNWRSILWFLALYGAVTTLLILVALPETHTKRGNLDIKEPVKQPGLNLVKILLLDPLKTLRYLSRPPVLLTVYYASITYCFLFMMNISIENTFQKDPYRFSIIITGLLYIPNALGYIVASILGGRWMDYIMKREARKSERYDEDGGLIYHPEDRVRENAWLAAFLYPAGLLWYGWTADRGVAWPIPMVATFFFGLGSMIIFNMSTTMLTEFLPHKPSAGVAINNFVRNILGFVGTLATVPIIEAIGNGWLFTIAGLLALVSASVLWVMKVRGPRWRESVDVRERSS